MYAIRSYYVLKAVKKSATIFSQFHIYFPQKQQGKLRISALLCFTYYIFFHKSVNLPGNPSGLIIENKIVSIQLSESLVSLSKIGDTKQVTATPSPLNAANKTLTWSSNT